MISRKLSWLTFAWLLALAASGCGGGGKKTIPPPALTITNASLPDWMETFPYAQTIQAYGGVAPFSWSITSGNLPHGLSLEHNSSTSATISGTPDVAGSATFTIQAKDSQNQTATHSYTVNIQALVNAKLREGQGQVASSTVEIEGVSAGAFNAVEWQQNTLNLVADVRIPLLAPLPGAWQNIYSPWALEQPDGWRLFYGGWDGSDTPNDRVYSATTSDFISFNNRALVIDHGAFPHVNNMSISQAADGSLHMICTVLQEPADLDKPAYFFSPDGITWNGSPAPYAAQAIDVVSIPNDTNYFGWDFNGGNVLLWDGGNWTLYYSVGVYGGIGKVFRATSGAPPTFQKTGVALNTLHYANYVRKFQVGGKNWYIMLLYIEEAAFGDVQSPVFSYSLSNDGITFGVEQSLFGGAGKQDHFVTTPSLVSKGSAILGVLYGANPVDLLNPQNAIYARWLQKRLVITDSSGMQYSAQGAYGPDRQWFTVPQSIAGTISVYAEDGVTPIGKGSVNVSGAQSYVLVLN
jgi:hypothetical protein